MPDLPPASEAAEQRRQSLVYLLQTAGREAINRDGGGTIQRKADGSAVTDADLACEAILVAGLQREFPRDRIEAEESGTIPPVTPMREPPQSTWFVDPIDGTSSYIERLAYWGPTIARRTDGRWDHGLLHLPALNQTWFASRELGPWLGNVKLSQHDATKTPPRTILMPSRAHHLGPLAWRGRTRSLGGTAAHLALVASGQAAATVVPQWSPWDVGAGLLLLELTGHITVDLSGRPCDPMNSLGSVFVAGTPEAAPRVARMVRDAFASLSGS